MLRSVGAQPFGLGWVSPLSHCINDIVTAATCHPGSAPIETFAIRLDLLFTTLYMCFATAKSGNC